MANDSPEALVIDDDPLVGMMLVRVLEKQGFTSLHAETGEGGIQSAELHQDSIRICFLDFNLPGVEGQAMYETLNDKLNCPVVLMSGSPEVEIQERMNGISFRFLPKPFTIPQLIEMLGQLRVAP